MRSRQDAADDARATAIRALTQDLAGGLQTITWFAFAARWRASLFTEQTIVDYDGDMRAHLSATIQGLVGVAQHDSTAYRALAPLAREVWELDGRVAVSVAEFWSDPDTARRDVGGVLERAFALEQALPARIVDVLRPGEGDPDGALGADVAAPGGRDRRPPDVP